MVRPVALLATLALLLSGCASSPSSEDEPAQATSPTTFTVTGDNRIEEPVVTDTLHMLALPSATTRAPDSYNDLRVPVPAFDDIAASSTGSVVAEWRYDIGQAIAGVVGTATFWVEVDGVVLGNPNPISEHCFWEFRFLTGDVNTGNSHYAPCVQETGSPIAEGLRELTFTFDLPGVVVAAGEPLRFQLYSQDFGRAPGTSVDVLTASIVHDSRVQIAGLQLPLDTQSLLVE